MISELKNTGNADGVHHQHQPVPTMADGQSGKHPPMAVATTAAAGQLDQDRGRNGQADGNPSEVAEVGAANTNYDIAEQAEVINPGMIATLEVATVGPDHDRGPANLVDDVRQQQLPVTTKGDNNDAKVGAPVTTARRTGLPEETVDIDCDASDATSVIKPVMNGEVTTGGQPEPVVERPGLSPPPVMAPKRRVDLHTVALSIVPEAKPIELLTVKEMKGINAIFTPLLAEALKFHGLVHKPVGEFDDVFQIVTGPLLRDPRVASRTRRITFVPAFAWATCEIVIAPIKDTRFGAAVFHSLQSLQPRFPFFKVFVEWNDVKKRHVVNEVAITADERELISKTPWPTRDQLIEALQMVAYDDINDLAQVNDEIRTVLAAREVK